MGRIGETCRHDVTPRSACKLCKAEDAKMKRRSLDPGYIPRKRGQPPLAERRDRLIEKIIRTNREQENNR